MAATETTDRDAAAGEAVSVRYVGTCQEGNCTFTVDCENEVIAHRTAGRHEGSSDHQHKVDIQEVLDD